MKTWMKVLFVLVISFPTMAFGASRDSLFYQGVVVDADGSPLNGTLNVTFRIYVESVGGDPIWQEVQSTVFDAGSYVTELGKSLPLPDEIFEQESLFLTLQIEGDTEMEPRLGLYSVPWSREAEVAVMAMSLADNIVTGDKIVPEGIGSRELADTGVSPGTYKLPTITVDSDGRILSIASNEVPQVLKGEPGANGDKGDTGSAGPAGPQGLQGPTGAAGPQGSAGPKGDIGSAGQVGPQGLQGSQGLKGDTGATGPQGPKGDAGATGSQGDKGDAGSAGSTGAQGPQGVKGDTGLTGAQGAQGVSGAVGATGDQGPAGPSGSTLVTGTLVQSAANATKGVTVTATATCATGKVLFGGGGSTTTSDGANLQRAVMQQSYPSSTMTWTVVGIVEDSGLASAQKLNVRAYALCSL